MLKTQQKTNLTPIQERGFVVAGRKALQKFVLCPEMKVYKFWGLGWALSLSLTRCLIIKNHFMLTNLGFLLPKIRINFMFSLHTVSVKVEYDSEWERFPGTTSGCSQWMGEIMICLRHTKFYCTFTHLIWAIPGKPARHRLIPTPAFFQKSKWPPQDLQMPKIFTYNFHNFSLLSKNHSKISSFHLLGSF